MASDELQRVAMDVYWVLFWFLFGPIRVRATAQLLRLGCLTRPAKHFLTPGHHLGFNNRHYYWD
jgi:hypothetical protein